MTGFISNLPELQLCARRTATRLLTSGAFSPSDRDDLTQELLVDAWVRFRHFDPSRASAATFAQRIMTHRAASIIQERNVTKRGWRFPHDTLDDIEANHINISTRGRP